MVAKEKPQCNIPKWEKQEYSAKYWNNIADHHLKRKRPIWRPFICYYSRKMYIRNGP